MNSDGQLRHFNCTIPRQWERRRGERRAKREALARGWRGGDGEKEEKDGHRGCAVCVGDGQGMVGGWTGTRNDRPSAHAYNYNNIT